MNKIIGSFAFAFLVHSLAAQSLELQVIGSSGNYSTSGSGSSLSATLGEPITETFSNGSILTQGFQQSFVLITAIGSPVKAHIHLYPNPTSSSVTIETPGDKEYRLELTDVLGKTLIHQKIQGPIKQLDLETLAPATYFIRLSAQDQIQQTFKLVKYQ